MKINQYPNSQGLADSDLFLVETSAGTKTTTLQRLTQFFSPKKIGALASNTKASDIGGLMDQTGAAFANSVVHEYSLGDRFTEEQSDDIRSGAFKIVRVGGYWTINGHVYWAAHADYRLNTGKVPLTEHHMLVVPSDKLFSSTMNEGNTTSGGYLGSVMKTTGLKEALQIIETDFGSSHILPYGAMLSNAVTGWAWVDDQKIDLMNEHMVYGASVWCKGANSGYNAGTDKGQLALFRARPDIIAKSSWYWLRDVVDTQSFCCVGNSGGAYGVHGIAGILNAGYSGGVRPAFLVY